MRRRDVVGVIGHLTVDDIVLPDGRTNLGTPGGDVLYACLGMRIWGCNPVIITCRSEGYPRATMEALVASGVDLSKVIKSGATVVRQWALYDLYGGRRYVPITEGNYFDISPLPDMYSKEFIASISAAHIAPMPASVQEEWVNALSGNGAYVSLDPHEDWMGDEAAWRRILRKVNAFLPSTVEVSKFLRRPWTDVDAAKEISLLGPEVVVIKQGEQGSLVYQARTDEAEHVDPVGSLLVDPTGCGDSYCGGFLSAISNGHGPVAGAQWGSVSASFVMEDYGPFGAMRATRPMAEERRRVYANLAH